MFSKFKKFSLATLLAMFVFVTIGGSLFYAQPAKAQLPVTVTSDIPGKVGEIIDSILTALLEASTNLAMQSATYLMRRVAYDTAVWLASGGKGQSPLAHYKEFGSYMADAADNAAGLAIEALGTKYGLNLCKIPDPKIDLAMRIGLTTKFLDLNSDLNTQPGPGGRKPACTLTEFYNDVLNTDNWQSQFGGADDIARKFNVAFSVDQTDVGILMGATAKIDSYVAKKVEAVKLERQEGGGYLDKKTPISNQIVTPAAEVGRAAASVSPSEQEKTANQVFLAYLGTGFKNSAMSALSLFTNTLASQMLKNWKEKGMFPFVSCAGNLADGLTCDSSLQDTLNNLEGQVSRGGRAAAQALFSDLLTPPSVSVDQYNILTNFTSCPGNPAPDNCVADTSLAQAAQEANTGKPITIGEALEKNWLHGEWKLISPDRIADNVDSGCYLKSYCYANIAKLRKARILPLGFEIAALNSNPDKPWTLKQVVDGFNDCNFIRDINGKVVGVDNDPVNKPFCHLIDPSWVIKAPPSKCNFMAFGSTPYFSGTPNRVQECVDMTTCVAYDKDGNCATQGYCTREKNVWKIDANKCDSQYRTCRAFQDSEGKTVSYLHRTLDTGFCTQDTVGCAQYSLKQDSTGKWVGYSRNDLNIGENSTIYFNNKVSTNCSSNSDGCSSFQVVDSVDKLYLRKAPYYSGCYDTDSSTLAVDWPRSLSDINRLPTKPACDNYAQACIADEINCNWYEPASYAGDNIPGKFTPAAIVENQIVWNDQCDGRCVGYAAFREMPSNYSSGQSLAYIIPSSGAKCSAIDEGCASFTNLSATSGGLEKVEHFSYLRPCILPDVTKQKNFFTFEGSAVGGFQLKAFILEKDTDGSPKYFYRTAQDLAAYGTICSESLYRQGLASPDCRQFNDDQGAVYYKLLSKTIAVSNSCTPYRSNDTELHDFVVSPPLINNEANCLAQKGKWDAGAGTCQVCFQNGEYRDGQCFYYGLPGGITNTAGASQTCAASVNTCRAYKGNAGNNVQNIFSNSFEQTNTVDALAGWGPSINITQSLESTHRDEHSLSYSGNGSVYKNLNLRPGESYDLVFWAKGSIGETVTVTLENNQVATLGTVSVGDVWQSYHLGPVELPGDATSTQLKFSINGRLFLDNVRLKEIADYIYLVKNTLSVNPICDSNLNDNLPGEALGCSQYQTPDNRSIYLTGFTSLCREKAIGCTALYDTRNTPDDPEPSAYNVWLPGNEGQRVTQNIGGRDYTCQIAVGQSGCYINVVGTTLADIIAGGGVVVSSTVYIQPDSPSSTPVYLVADREASCGFADLGCTKVGKLVQTPTGPTYADLMVKKDPASFSATLCQSEAVGCNSYASSDGILYFKDPQYLGQKVCAYRDNVTKDGVGYKGWFWKGVGKCISVGSAASGFCVNDSDCQGGARCQEKDEQPCYPNYLQSGNDYGLWSYGVSSTYDNFVGECPPAQNGCTEFIDHNENNKLYYLINDERLKSKQTECNGEVSEKSGCILLDKTDTPNKLWNTARSYAASAGANNNLVAAVPGTGAAPADANIILKVNRDRECGEWLQCRSSHRVFDAQAGSYKEICDDIGRCNEALPSAGNSDIINCANWLDNTHELSDQVLTDDAYRNRNTDWRGQDFSGLSILNMFPAEELTEINFGTITNSDWRLVKTLACGAGSNCRSATDASSAFCRTNVTIGSPCGRSNTGVCLGPSNPICVQNLDGQLANDPRQSMLASCRAYPEETSPFPNSKAIEESLPFSSVNLCNETNGFTTDEDKSKSCECNYTKVTYGDAITKYWNFSKPNNNDGILNSSNQSVKSIVSGICLGGSNAERVCVSDSDCASGSCQKIKKQSRLIGWQGYCVEPDFSRPLNAEQNSFACLTWFPKDNITGAFDINNQHVEAGFQASDSNGKYYCLRGKGNQFDQTSLPSAFWIGTEQFTYNKSVGGGNITHNVDDGPDRLWRIYSQTDPALPVALTSKQIYRDEIDYIAIEVSGNGGWFPNGRRTFFIRNGLITKYNGPTRKVVSRVGSEETELINPQLLTNEATGVFGEQYVWSDGRDKQYWYMRYDDGEEGNNLPDGDEYQFADPYSSLTDSPFEDLLRSGNPGCGSIDVPHPGDTGDEFQQYCLGGDKDDYDDGCAIRVVFDNDSRLDRINVVCFTGNADNDEHLSYRLYAGLREPCTSIAQTENDAYSSVGWTDRLWAGSPTPFIVDQGGLSYRNSLVSVPFGSLGMFSPLIPEQLINVFTHFNDLTITPPPAVVGSPYGCLGKCLQTSPTVDEHRNAINQSTVAEGNNFLSQIFAKIDSVWNWTFNSTLQSWEYKSNPGNDATTISPYNVTESLSSPSKAPQVHPLGVCKQGGKCLESNASGITINDKLGDDIVFSNSTVLVNAKFYGFADKNQMPIKKVKLDWDDGSVVSLDGYFRNQRGAVNGTCGTNKTCLVPSTDPGGPAFNTGKTCASNGDCQYLDNCFGNTQAPNFGQILGQTCDSAYFRFDHVYQCERGNVDLGWTNNCPDPQTQTLHGGCCVFKPSVQLTDNWGWCNGACRPGPPGGTGGCYNTECGTVNASTSFSGRILVVPAEE